MNSVCITQAFSTPVLAMPMQAVQDRAACWRCRCHEAPFVLEHGQVVGRLVYERMAEPPTQLYGADLASNYQGQGLKLSKHFKSP